MEERTGWRDEEISARHRKWGICYAVDIDFLLVEYRATNGDAEPVALVEYKHELAARKTLEESSPLQALKQLADGYGDKGLPFFVVRYPKDFTWILISPVNDAALAIIGEKWKTTEEEYVCFLYELRGLEMPDGLAASLSAGRVTGQNKTLDKYCNS